MLCADFSEVVMYENGRGGAAAAAALAFEDQFSISSDGANCQETD